MTSKMVYYSSQDSPYGSDENRGLENSSDLADTLRRLKQEIRSCKVDNDKIMQVEDKQVEVNVVILQNLLELQRQGTPSDQP